MSKPSWDDAPEWANWLAMDQDGYWFWYEHEPSTMVNGWDNDKGGMYEYAGPNVLLWRETLEKKPQN